MNFIKKHKLLVVLLCLFLLPTCYTFSRYVGNWFYNHYLEAEQFFFNSNKLTTKKPLYRIDNWSGVGSFTIPITVSSMANELLKAEMDISYDIEYYCQSDVSCVASQDSGTIYAARASDSFSITITPNREFQDGESTTLDIYATSNSPYKKRLGATFVIKVGKQGIAYEIIDSKNSPYLNLVLTNSLASYRVQEAFLGYTVGQEIDEDTYLQLDASNQAKCYSAMVTLSFDPREVILDTTQNLVKGATLHTVEIDGIAYIDQITFTVKALSSTEIRFYKLDITQDYTFPYQNNTSIINVS